MKKNSKLFASVFAIALVAPLGLMGCNKEISSERRSTVSSDGSTKTKEKTVSETPSGGIVKEESTTKTTPTR